MIQYERDLLLQVYSPFGITRNFVITKLLHKCILEIQSKLYN